MRQFPVLLACALLILGASFAQESLDNDSVMKLVRAGLSEDAVVRIVETQPGNYSTGPDDLVSMRKAGVTDRIIAAMNGKETPESDTPKELGVYWKQGDNWIQVLPEVVHWQTGGVAKNKASLGVVKPDLNGIVYGGRSSTRVGTSIEFLIRLPEETAITEYELLHLHAKKDTREFRLITGGVIHRSGGPRRALLPFDFKKVAAQIYVVRLTGLEAGEFGFLSPASAGARHKLYSFSVGE